MHAISGSIWSAGWRCALASAAYAAGAVAGGGLMMKLGVAMPTLPAEADDRKLFLYMLAGNFVLSAGVVPLARCLAGGFSMRVATLAFFAWVAMGLNTAIEAAIFTTYGHMPSLALQSVLPILFWSAAMVALFRPSPDAVRNGSTAPVRDGGLAWRIVLAVLAFPLVYLAIGTPVGLLVGDLYREGAYGLRLPAMSTIIAVQMLRSPLFLLATWPILSAWQGRKARLAVALGLAFSVLVGVAGLIQAHWMPPLLRVLHSVEITIDSFLYAAIVTWLLAGRRPASRDVASELPVPAR